MPWHRLSLGVACSYSSAPACFYYYFFCNLIGWGEWYFLGLHLIPCVTQLSLISFPNYFWREMLTAKVIKCPPNSSPQRSKNCTPQPTLKKTPTKTLTKMTKEIYQNWECIWWHACLEVRGNTYIQTCQSFQEIVQHTIRSFSSHNGNGYDDVTNEEFDWSNR